MVAGLSEFIAARTTYHRLYKTFGMRGPTHSAHAFTEDYHDLVQANRPANAIWFACNNNNTNDRAPNTLLFQ